MREGKFLSRDPVGNFSLWETIFAINHLVLQLCCISSFSYCYIRLAPVVQTLDSAIHWINHYPLDNSTGFASVYPLASLSGGQRYPSFEQLGPDD